MAKNKRKDYSGIIAIIIVVLILLTGAFMVLPMLKDEMTIIDKPEVTVSVGTENPMYYTAKLSFEGNVDKLKKISDEEYKELVSEALNDIGEENLSGPDGTDYVKEKVKEKLMEKLKTNSSDDFEITSVFIDKFVGNGYAPAPKKEGPSGKDVADMFKTNKNKSK